MLWIGRNEMKEQIAAQTSQNKPELAFFERSLGMTMQGKGRKLIFLFLLLL